MNKEDIVDEMCICGHLQSSHAAAEHLGGAIQVKGHGACRVCQCEKFTFARFIGKDEIAQHIRKGARSS